MKARILDTAGTREEAWSKAVEYVKLLNLHDAQARWLINVRHVRGSVWWIEAVPA